MIPLFQKSETYEPGPNMPTHGSNGPLKVSYGGDSGLGVWKEFVDVGSQFEVDRPIGVDGNAFYEESINVFGRNAKWISSEGRRSDVAHHYLYNKNFPNLTVCDGCLVNRVVIENGVATGVEYLFNNQVHESAPQSLHLVKARELVVVSGGTMGSPLILERSGIGRTDILQRADIPVVVDLPGVGEGYQDHILLCPLYLIDSNEKTMDALFRGDPETLRAAQEQWDADGSGLMSTNGVEAGIKLRPRPHELPELGPEFMEYWDAEGFADKPDKPVLSVGPLAMGLNSGDASLASLKAISIATFLCYPISRGHFHISSSDPSATPDFKSGFLSSPGEVAALRWGYKKGREIA
ncbi:GMC oxidoreductase-domain-containing protein [Roridomyces roridus]|uniref:GMC oxidoreductase-domain-containing protein n=1 Tax=Roridomyces roridus TaxID=1738132 RepID=A0AAD7B113_9AGAR|nr:GMC oxidoreductase-domain-containing protein [Roridomyces roridus]